MKLNKGKNGYWLYCSPCAATFMDTKNKSLDAFLAHYSKRYRELRGDPQLTLFDGVIA